VRSHRQPQTVNKAAFNSFARRYGVSKQELRSLTEYLISGGAALHTPPASVREFLESPHYMGAKTFLYPAVVAALEELNGGAYEEAVLSGAIGAGKSTIALYTQAYQLYVLSCYRDPHALFHLDPSSEILIVFQNLNLRLARSVEFDRFRDMLASSPYFVSKFAPDPRYDTELRFPRRIVVKPVTGLESGTVGQNVIGGVIDEVNLMSIIQRSRRSVDGGAYDQATALYDSIARRRKSRFLRAGRLPGMLCLVSSKRYPGEFTERKIAEAHKERATRGSTSIFVYDKALWEAKPPGTYRGEWFHLFIGDAFRKPRILADQETLPPADEALVRNIPVEFRSEFERDPLNALRDIAGIATRALSPFILDGDALGACRRDAPCLVTRESVDLEREQIAFLFDRFDRPTLARWAHVDLGLTSDSAGIAVGYASHFVDRPRGSGAVERLPSIHIDFVLEIVPPPNGEISISGIRNLFYVLRQGGVNIRYITYDGYQSRESLQILRRQGFCTDVTSVDRNLVPYELLKNALYDKRVSLPSHEKLFRELLMLEFHAATRRIDHPASKGGSKDLADAVAAVTYRISTRRETWAMHAEPLTAIPTSIASVLKPGLRSPEEYFSQPQLESLA